MNSGDEHTDTRLENYLLGDMKEQERTAFEEALKRDPALARALEEERMVHTLVQFGGRAVLKQKLREINLNRKRKFRSRIWLAAASVLILLTTGLFFFLHNGSITDAALFAEYYHPEKDHLTQMGAPLETRLQHAMELYDNGKYAEALPLFNSLPDSLPEYRIARIYAGICLLETNNIEEARELFENESAIPSPLYNSTARWYLALTYLKLSKREACRDLLKKLAAEHALVYGKLAAEMLKEME